jgi:preprotein translocase subunit Sec61beta
MADELRIPSSGGGIVRYSDEDSSKVKIKPIHVVAALIVVIVLELFLRFVKL